MRWLDFGSPSAVTQPPMIHEPKPPSQLSIRLDSTDLANDSTELYKHLDNIHSVKPANASRPEANSSQQ